MYKVTIAMPVYNVANYVEQSLLSALNQTFDSIEFLVVDDKGTDNSIEIVKRIQQSHPRGKDIRIIDHVVNQGTGATKNSAMKEASGEYLYFMDSDDTIIPETIEILYKKIKETNADVVTASYQIIKNNRTYTEVKLPNKIVEGPMALCEWMNKTGLYFNLFTWNKLYKTEFLRDNHIYCVPNHRNEDTLFTFEVVLYATSIVTLDAITYNYYMRPGSVVHQRVNDFYYNQYIEILHERIKYLRNVQIKTPSPIYNYLLEPFFEYFLCQVLNSNYNEAKKTAFIKEMQLIYELDFSEKDLYSYRYKQLYRLIKKGNIQKILDFYHRDYLLSKIYRKVVKFIPFYNKPYNHL